MRVWQDVAAGGSQNAVPDKPVTQMWSTRTQRAASKAGSATRACASGVVQQSPLHLTAWPASSWAGCRRDCLQKPKIAIKLMRMAKPDQGCIDYRLTGKLAGQDIDIDASAKFDFSLTTGAVLRHEESYGYDRCAAAKDASCTTLKPS